MSGKLLRLLGPVRKRISDRIKEATIILQQEYLVQLQSIRAKLASNSIYHDELMKQLNDLTTESDEISEKVDSELEVCHDDHRCKRNC